MTNHVIAALKNLELIEQNLDHYEDDAPPSEVIAGVREFLKALSDEDQFEGLQIPEPKLVVSPKGHILISIGADPQSIDILVSPTVTFWFQHPRFGVDTGEGMENVLDVIAAMYAS